MEDKEEKLDHTIKINKKELKPNVRVRGSMSCSPDSYLIEGEM